MKKYRRRCLLFILIVLFLSVLTTALLFHRSEPKYQGRTLRHWTKVLWAGSPDEQTVARKAVRTMGPNAIPTLRRMLTRKDSKLKVTFLDLCNKQSLVRYPNMDYSLDQQRLALKAADVLEEKARPLVPLLQQMIQDWRAQSLDVVYESSRIAKRFEPKSTPDLVVHNGKPMLFYPSAGVGAHPGPSTTEPQPNSERRN